MSREVRPTRRGGWGRRFRETILTVGAVLGVLCLGWAIAMSVFGITPLVFSSGSMAPEIATGDLAFARSVPADDLRRGDVVSVAGESGVRVTHRIVAVERADDRTSLTLKGDGNASPDTDTYTVTETDRVFTHVPKAGYAVSAVASPTGVFVGGLLVAAALFAAFGPGSGRPRGGRRRADVAAAGLVLVALGASTQAPPVEITRASFSDDASLTTGSFAAHTVLPPASASCSDGLLTATISWPGDVRYDYEVVLRRVSTGAVVSTRQITGAASSTTYVGLLSFGLVVGLGPAVDFKVEIRSKLATATSWESSTVRTYGNVRVLAAVIGATVSCTT
jgi:signal peptidase I